MKKRWLVFLLAFCVAGPAGPLSWAKDNNDNQGNNDNHGDGRDDGPQFPQNVSFTTLRDAANPANSLLLPFAIEGLTGDANGNLYTTGRQLDATKLCPVWKISVSGLNATRTTVGFIPNNPACGPSGITFDKAGNLYIADSASGGNVRKVTPAATGCASDDSTDPACSTIPVSTNYATNVPGANGLVFDQDGNLWTGDGVTGLGRVWKIGVGGGNCAPPTPTGCAEVFRIQPMRNGTALGGDITAPSPPANQPTQGVGRQANTFPHTAAGGNPQDLVANGLTIDRDGDMMVIDTARGALWRIKFDHNGNPQLRTGCDSTFTDNTLCLSHIFVAHPILEGGDGIALDVAGNVWVDANERQAVAVVTTDGRVIEVFRNPVNAAGFRNTGDTAEANKHILELPTSPFLTGRRFCTAQSDGNRRDNFPQAGGEINAGAPLAVPDPGKRAKISCMTDPQTGNLIQLDIPGLPLPVH